MSNRSRRKATLLLPLLVIAIAACSGSGGTSTGGPSSTPSSGATATPNVDTIDHPTGATEVILRYDEGGGFVMPAFAATMVPHFTMYGDGTIVFRDPAQQLPPQEGSVVVANPLRTARLTEEQVQDVLVLALGEGGLGAARPEYRDDRVADASTAVFTIQAGGISKSVAVYALGIESGDGPDAPARAAFARLAQRLTTIEQGGVIVATDYEPAAYRGILIESPRIVVPDMKPWPWADVAPADFALDIDPSGFGFPHRTMTRTEMDALGVSGYLGGLQNLVLTGPNGMTYTLSVRPLLPDETR